MQLYDGLISLSVCLCEKLLGKILTGEKKNSVEIMHHDTSITYTNYTLRNIQFVLVTEYNLRKIRVSK